jgi:hypothetical protein
MKKSTLGALVVVVVFLVAGGGCASLMSGSTQDVKFSSQPSGARISVLDTTGFEVASGQTPTTLTLDRGKGFFTAARYKVVVEKLGYAKKEFQIKGELNAGWYLVGNFFVGWVVGWIIIDPITGAMWNLSPAALSSSLEVAGITDDGSIKVVLLETLDPALLALATPLGAAD